MQFCGVFPQVFTQAGDLLRRHIGPANASTVGARALFGLFPRVIPHIEGGIDIVEVMTKDPLAGADVGVNGEQKADANQQHRQEM